MADKQVPIEQDEPPSVSVPAPPFVAEIIGSIPRATIVHHVDDASLYLGGHKYEAGEDGTIAVPLAPGEHEVCTEAVNHDGGPLSTLLGCEIVQVAAGRFGAPD